ncbi:MAG: LCP family protein, partial [Solobacterium sp.]|nr:LCP family protein [Solobacterium sp.]
EMDIDNYFLINFTSFIRIIDALGGVDVDNPYAFTYTWDTNFYYPEGNIHLDGQAALFYVRERYNLPDGDFGRNMHQQIVLRAIIDKATSPIVVARFNSLLDSLDGAFLTNISTDSIYALCRRQLDENIRWEVITRSLEGEIGFGECASVPGTELSIVRPDSEQIQEAIAMIAALKKGEILEKEADED